jgi:tetratricopeptide (TPR) repeat protein
MFVSAGPLRAGTGADSPSPAALLEAARRAVAAEDYGQAIERYADLRRLMPQAPELPYNMGVAAYRDGDLDRAAEYFGEALALAEDLPLRSKSAYNLGTTAYARNLQPAAPGGAGEENPGGQLDGAIEELRHALDHYRQAIDADPRNGDAKANAELTYRRLKRLEELREQMQQTQQNQQDQQDQQDQQEREDQQSPQSGQQEPQEPGDQPQPDQQEESGEQQAQPQGQQQEQQQEQQAAEAQEEQAEDAAQRRTMTRQEAERLLQSVRDKERRRREELADQQQGRRPPVDKDW